MPVLIFYRIATNGSEKKTQKNINNTRLPLNYIFCHIDNVSSA